MKGIKCATGLILSSKLKYKYSSMQSKEPADHENITGADSGVFRMVRGGAQSRRVTSSKYSSILIARSIKGRQRRDVRNDQIELFLPGLICSSRGCVVASSREIGFWFHAAYSPRLLSPGAILSLCTFCWPSVLSMSASCSNHWDRV